MFDLSTFRKSSNLLFIFKCERMDSFGYKYKVLCRNTSTLDITELSVESFKKVHVPVFPASFVERIPNSGIYECIVNNVKFIYNSFTDVLTFDNTILVADIRQANVDAILRNLV